MAQGSSDSVLEMSGGRWLRTGFGADLSLALSMICVWIAMRVPLQASGRRAPLTSWFPRMSFLQRDLRVFLNFRGPGGRVTMEWDGCEG